VKQILGSTTPKILQMNPDSSADPALTVFSRKVFKQLKVRYNSGSKLRLILAGFFSRRLEKI